MTAYRLNPFISFIENRLFPGVVQRAVFHRLTGEIFEPGEGLDVSRDGPEVRQLIHRGFLIPDGYDPLAPLLDYYVARPVQNPAVTYHAESGELVVVRTSMDQTVYSRRRDDLPPVVEEKLSALAAEILLMADGSKTLQQIFATVCGRTNEASLLQDAEFRQAVDFLTTQQRQLIKFTPQPEDVADPYSWLNIVPRNLYHAERKDQPLPDSANEAIIDFHVHGIEDANWEFDQIEPTVNHGFRFPHEALGGFDYGSRFCLSTLTPEVLPLINSSFPLEVLEVGGGTGTFARSFIRQASNLTDVNYHILDLSPALIENQRQILSDLLPENRHFQQDATEFELPDHTFDLIVSNEVIADLPVASVQRNNGKWAGDGACYLDKYDLSTEGAPDSFMVNAGVFRFIERAWKHLKPGGTFVVSEYGSEDRYALPSFNLNHDEYTIHFGHLVTCATKIGFQCRLLTLKEFLAIDDEVEVLAGREEHLLCLNHVLKNSGVVLPYAVIAKSDFEARCGRIVEDKRLSGYTFLPLNKAYHFGPNIRDFFVLIMNKPREEI